MNVQNVKNISQFEDKSLLIVDDDNPFRERLARAMEKKGFKVSQAEGVKKGIDAVKTNKPAFAVVDLRLGDGNGLEVVKEIQNSNADSRIVMLTGYGNIPTAVAAIKQGAIDYLAKPVDVELRKNLWENIRSLRKLGVTIILTTHYLQEAEELCDRVGIIHKGNLIALDTTENMLNKIQTKTIKFEINKRIVLDDINDKNYNILTNTDSEFKIEYNKQEFNIQKIIKLLENQEIVIKDIKSEDPDLEDVFVNLTNN